MTELNCDEVLVLGHMPPPITGVSAINQVVVAELGRLGRLSGFVNLTPVGPQGVLLYFVRRLGLAALSVLELYRAHRRGGGVLYMPLDGGIGLALNSLFGLVANVLGFRVFVHHHSFAYINEYRWLMTLLLRCLPKETTHIFLCDGMAGLFQARYSQVWERATVQKYILSNAFILGQPPTATLNRPVGKPLVLGHLSNLCADKGTHLFLDLFELIHKKFGEVRIRLAGPILEDDLKVRVEKMASAYGGLVEWVGPVSGLRKTEFFDSIDLFVFPTLYQHEAQPLVLLEALSFGIPIVSIRRGCIAFDYDESVGIFSETAEEFLETTLSFFKLMKSDRKHYANLRKSAFLLATERRASAQLNFEMLFDVMKKYQNAA